MSGCGSSRRSSASSPTLMLRSSSSTTRPRSCSRSVTTTLLFSVPRAYKSLTKPARLPFAGSKRGMKSDKHNKQSSSFVSRISPFVPTSPTYLLSLRLFYLSYSTAVYFCFLASVFSFCSSSRPLTSRLDAPSSQATHTCILSRFLIFLWLST